ncbi:MAG: ABC transporter substrate-binding protein [Actinobacteria bacterium]|nr:ABC transporter substrate-binding protein [Actinomycetota bacterium]
MSTRLKTALVVVLLLTLTASVGVGCSRKAAKPKTGGKLTAFLAEPKAIDPYNAQETEGMEVVANIFDGLVKFDPKTSAIKPAVAEKWESNKDATVWTFTLREGTKFHNGREVEAKDFKFAWERIANPKTTPPSDVSYHLAPIKGFDEMQAGSATELSGVKVKDKNTLEVTLSYPFADFIFVTGHPALAPVPREEVEKDPKAFSEKPVGNGPFMMAEPWKHNQFIKIKRFDGYYAEKATLDQVTFKIFKDEETAFKEFEAGTLDYTKQIPTGQIKATVQKFGESSDGYEATPGGDVLLGAETAVYYLNANNTNEFLKNPDVRRAISLAIDRQAIVKTIYEGTRKPATGLVPPGVVGFKKDAGKFMKFDKEEAKKLLEKAGFPGGKGLPPFKLSFNPGAGHEKVMELVQANLKEIGIQTELPPVEWAQFVTFRQKGQHEIARDGWTFDYPIIDNMLYPLFFSKNIGKDNTTRFSNPEVDKLILEARQETKESKRVEKYQKAEELILNEVGAIPLNFYAHRAVAQKKVRGLVYSPLNITYYNTITIEE